MKHALAFNALFCATSLCGQLTVQLNGTGADLSVPISATHTLAAPYEIPGSDAGAITSAVFKGASAGTTYTVKLERPGVLQASWPVAATITGIQTSTVTTISIGGGRSLPIANEMVFLVNDGTTDSYFKLLRPTAPGVGGGGARGIVTPLVGDAAGHLRTLYPTIEATRAGLVVTKATYKYSGERYIHVFFDQNGNPLSTTPPQGIANYQYVVHILYPYNSLDPTAVSYSVLQSKGSFLDALVIRNSEAPNPDFESRASERSVAVNMVWGEIDVLLSTSTTDIEFSLLRTTETRDVAGELTSKVKPLGTYTIKMTKVYHGSIDAGFMYTRLANPQFSLVADPAIDTLKVVKRTGDGSRGVVTLMATFYTSPIVVLRTLFVDDEIVPEKMGGRNFLDDHKWWERVYPTIGVGISEKAAENVFLGFNWELARGLSLFGGKHYGKVNVYDAPEGFQFGVDHQTQAEFDLHSDSRWEWSDKLVWGVNVDLLVVTRLLSRNGTTGP